MTISGKQETWDPLKGKKRLMTYSHTIQNAKIAKLKEFLNSMRFLRKIIYLREFGCDHHFEWTLSLPSHSCYDHRIPYLCLDNSSLVFLGVSCGFRHGEGTCRYSQVTPSAIKFVGTQIRPSMDAAMMRLATHGWDFRMRRHRQKAGISRFLKQNEMYKDNRRENQQLYVSKIL